MTNIFAIYENCMTKNLSFMRIVSQTVFGTFFFKCGTNYFETYLISRAISELGNSQTALAFFTTEPDRICGSCNFILYFSAKTFQFLFFFLNSRCLSKIDRFA